MYVPPHFDEQRPEILDRLIHDQPLGLMITAGSDGPDANLLPFLLEREQGGRCRLCAHVARANPVWREARSDMQTLVVFQGPEAYVSPSWYPSKLETGKAVPTWNYLMVQARGTLRFVHDPSWLRAHVERLTERHEGARPVPWTLADAPSTYIEAMLSAVVGVEIDVRSLLGKWKNSQNRSQADREGVARGLGTEGRDEASELARLLMT